MGTQAALRRAFHLTTTGVLRETQIPLLFAAAMAVDAAVALAVGRLYDRRGLVVLAAAPLATTAALMTFTRSTAFVWIGGVVWGAVLGIQESTLRAAVADLAHGTHRATAYGIFNAAYGLALLAGGTALGFLYERSLLVLVIFVVACELAAVLYFRRIVLAAS